MRIPVIPGRRKITARIGAEVTGVNPTLELDPETVTAIRAALNEHKALLPLRAFADTVSGACSSAGSRTGS